ncbi:Non-specific serine/threonine protein kinase [Bertholletia excelsa]
MKGHLYLPLLIMHCFACFNITYRGRALAGNVDKEALISFKLEISDPKNCLSSWNHSFSHYGRVRSLHLAGCGLSGTLSPHLSNLTSLLLLDLSKNSFSGQIPPEFGRLSFLRYLVLEKNSIYGPIPITLSDCGNLRAIVLSFNYLTGHLPPELGLLSRLQILDASANNLTGVIPSAFGNLSSLSDLTLARNHLSGTIPKQLGNLPHLQWIQLSDNHFTGDISPILNTSSLVFLSLTKNNFFGNLPSNIGFALPHAEELYLADNRFEGSIPVSLSNSSHIQYLELSQNHFQGPIPLLGRLNRLVFVNFGANNLSSTTERNLQFFESLTNCTKLELLILFSNQLYGELPSSVANLSFPKGLERFRNLSSMSIAKNFLTGELMALHENMFSGEIPDVFGNLSQLYQLEMGTNHFTGKIPSSIGECRHLTILSIARNRLVGTIPIEIFGLYSLNYLDLPHNSLSGTLPRRLGTMKQIGFLDVSGNGLSGALSETIGGCFSLRILNLSMNNFTGSIPKSVGQLVALEKLDLSSNNFGGPIPEELGDLKTLQELNLSSNHFEGQVPGNAFFVNIGWDALKGNYKLCANGQEVARRLRITQCNSVKNSNKYISLKILSLVVSPVIFVFGVLLLIWVFNSQKKKEMNREGISLFPLNGCLPKISYNDIQLATTDFADENLIGKGSFGSVYRGVFVNGQSEAPTTLAVKVLDLLQSKALKSFNAECVALRNVRHRNLVKVVTSCSSIDHEGGEFKAIVMEFMSNGNLESWLHPEDSESQKNLTLKQRLDIAIDIASAMDYLHKDCDPPIVHCDLKPSNILLDDDLGAHVGDFGLARLLHVNPPEYQSSTTGLKGTIGYIAPEYGFGNKVSTQGDVYSFGILLLEIFTAKKPTDEMFNEVLNLNKFAAAVEHNQVSNIVDAKLMKTWDCPTNSNVFGNWESAREQCLATLIRVGLSCAADSVGDRPTMREALTKLHQIKNILLG